MIADPLNRPVAPPSSPEVMGEEVNELRLENSKRPHPVFRMGPPVLGVSLRFISRQAETREGSSTIEKRTPAL